MYNRIFCIVRLSSKFSPAEVSFLQDSNRIVAWKDSSRKYKRSLSVNVFIFGSKESSLWRAGNERWRRQNFHNFKQRALETHKTKNDEI